MASPELLNVVALGNKAADLMGPGHVARALDYQGRAVTAAQALGANDCLIVASLQIRRARLLFATTPENSLRDGVLPLSRAQELLAPVALLFFAAADTVQRRLSAGTLLAGMCRPAEMTWCELTQEYAMRRGGGDLGMAALLAPFCGYETLIAVADVALLMLEKADRGVVTMAPQQQSICLLLLTAAVDLFLQPREGAFALSTESTFALSMERRVDQNPRLFTSFGGEQLLEKWRRIEQSGELKRRGVADALRAQLRSNIATIAAANAAAADPGLRSCALASCGAREQHASHFKSCGACKTVAYCCKGHQVEHWPSHKAACKAARK
jgi:hypothetical protein